MNLRLLLSSASVAAVVLHAASASAINVAPTYPQRINAGGRIAPPTGTTVNKTDPLAGINRADCFNTDQRWRWSIQNVPADATTIEIWARTNSGTCSQPGDRTSVSGSLPQCFKVVSWTREEVVNKFPEIGNLPIVQAVSNQTSVEDPASLVPAEVCAKSASMPPTDIFLHVMAFNGPNVIGATGGTGTGTGTGSAQEAIYQTIYDLAGPNPPTNITLGSGEQILVAKWDPLATPASDFKGYRLYCYRVPAVTGAATTGASTKEVDGGLDADRDADDALVDDTSVDDTGGLDDAATDAGDDATTTADGGTGELPANCPAGVPFEPGQVPPADITSVPGVTECAFSGTATGSISIQGLEDNAAYAVVVTATDVQGNSGIVSDVVCAMPKSTNSFFDNYNNAGGRAGGGYCTYGTSRVAPTGLALILGLGLAGRIVRRRTRRSR